MRKFLVIIVIYNRHIDEVKPFTFFKDLVNNGISILLYDNSPKAQDFENIYDNITYFHDPENGGISKAYNTGAQYALKNNIDWLILFDQDTLITDNYFLSLENSMNRFEGISLFAPIVHYNDRLMSPKKCKYFRPSNDITSIGLNKLDNAAIINSGLVVSVTTFIKCGGYNNGTFLDFSDYQFIERVRNVENNFVVFDSHLMQDFSNDETNHTKLFSRFLKYCTCLKNYQTTPIRRIMLLYTGFLHSLALFRRTNKIKFLHHYIKTILS